MRGRIGCGLALLCYFSSAVFGLWAILLDAGILLRLGGWLLLIAGLFFFPLALTIAPLYAGFAWGDWRPLQVTVAGVLMMFVTMGVGAAVVNKGKS